MNRTMLTIIYPRWRWWADYFIYFFSEDIDGMGRYKTVCILDTRTDELVADYRIKENENESLE